MDLDEATAALCAAGGGVAWCDARALPRFLRGPAAAAQVGAARSGEVAIVPLTGVIVPRADDRLAAWFGLAPVEGFVRRLGEAVANPRVSAVVVPVDSPGGLVMGVPEAADAMHAMTRRGGGAKPVVAVASYVAASAAYLLASQADAVVVERSGMVGSIGAIIRHMDVSRALDAAGITVTTITAGRFKAEAEPYRPLDKAARAHLQEQVDSALGMFAEMVARGRGVSAATVTSPRFGEGRMFEGPEAVRRGLADRTGSVASVIEDLRGGWRPTATTPRAEAWRPTSARLRAVLAEAAARGRGTLEGNER